MSQTNDILHHLQRIGPITPIEALQRYGCFRLAARVLDLRDEGHRIHTTMIETQGGKKVARYTLLQSA